MAIYVQPYNPWREQLATSIITPLIGDFLSNMRQNEQNKKTNAFRGALQDAISSQSQPVSLTHQSVPDGYNSDGWASAFHKTDTPMTQFDLGTSSLTPKTTSIQDIAQAANSLAASKRFSMMNPETVQGITNNMLQIAEAQRSREAQDLYTNLFRDANSFDDQMKVLAQAGFNGVGSPQMASVYNQWAQHRTPHMTSSNIDAGDRISTLSIDPLTGNVVSRYSTPKGIDPADVARNATTERVATIGANASMYNADRSAGASMYHTDATTGLGYAQLEQTRDEIRRKETNDQIKVLEDQKRAILESDYSSEQKNAMIAPINEDIARLRSSLTGGNQQNNNGTISFTAPINDGGQWGDIINKYSQQYDLDPDLVYAVIDVESGHKNGLTSPKGAQGLMQLMPKTAKGLGVTDSFDPDQNIRGGTQYLRQMLDMFDGNVEKAILAYNAGPSNIKAGRNPNPQYARDVLAIYNKRKAGRKQKTQTAPAQAQAQAQQTQSPLTGHPYLISPEGQHMSLDEFIDMAKRHQEGETGLFRDLELKGWTRDTRDNYQLAPKLDPAPRKTITLPADGDMRYSYMKPFMNTANTASPPITPLPVSDDIHPTQEVSPPDGSQSSYSSRVSAPMYNWLAPARRAVSRAYNSGFLPALNGDIEPSTIPQENNSSTGGLSDFLRNISDLGLSEGDNRGIIPDINTPTTFDPITYDPRYSSSFRGGYPIGVAPPYESTPSQFPNNFLDKNRRNSIPFFPAGYSRGDVEPVTWRFADFISALRQNNINNSDRNTLIQRFLNRPAFPNSFIGLDNSFFWPQVMDFPVRAYPYR